MEDYAGAGLTNNLMEIKATGETGEEAVARADAVAEAFVADHVRRIKQAAAADASTLLAQRDRMQKELDEVNKAIGDGPPEGSPEESANLETLFARRAELSSRISDFSQRAAEARVGTPRLIAGTQIVDAPHTVKHSLPRAVATNGGIGLVLGLVLGLVVAAVASVVGDRPVLRRDIARHLGASVTAELSRSALRRGLPGRRKRRHAARTRLTSSLATVRGCLEPLALLELGCARGAGVIALDLARTLGADEPVVVVDALPRHGPAGRRSKPGDVEVVGVERAAALPSDRRRIGVASVAPGAAWSDLADLAGRAVLVVAAGHGTTAWLHTVARQLADRRVEVAGVVLVDPDPRDRTDGTLWDGPFPVPGGSARDGRPGRTAEADRTPCRPWPTGRGAGTAADVGGADPGRRPGGAVAHVRHRRHVPVAGRQGGHRPAHRDPRPPRPGRVRHLRPLAGRRRGAPRAPQARHPRPVRHRRPADGVGRSGADVQRRAVQRAELRPNWRAPGCGSGHLGHRGAAGGVAALGHGLPAPAARHVRVRDLRRADR
ncbi:hypothetical protein STENM223S_11649 [Streptomyces tendae]